MSSAFHPQIDGQSERTIVTIKGMLRVCTIEWQEKWEKHLLLVEFACYNSFHISIGMILFKALYGKSCHAPGYWFDTDDRKNKHPMILQHYEDKVKIIWEKLRTAQHRKKCYADCRWWELKFSVGDTTFLKVSPNKNVLIWKKGKTEPKIYRPLWDFGKNWTYCLLINVTTKVEQCPWYIPCIYVKEVLTQS